MPNACDLDCPGDDVTGTALTILACTSSNPDFSEECIDLADPSGFGTSEAGPPVWFQFDMGESATAAALRYEADWWNKAPEDFEVWVSDSAESTPDTDATLVYSGTGGRAPQGRAGRPIDQTFLFDAEATGRYWYLRIVTVQHDEFLILRDVRFLSDLGCESICTTDTDGDGITDCYDMTANQLVINEIFVDSSVVEEDGQWFEVFNYSGRDLRTGGLTLSDSSGNSFTLADRELPAGTYWTFGRENSTGRNGGVSIDFEYGETLFFGTDDSLTLTSSSGEVVDTVVWSSAEWPVVEGASMLFCGDPTFIDNVDPEDWIGATSTFGDGDLGTPGEWNGDCWEDI